MQRKAARDLEFPPAERAARVRLLAVVAHTSPADVPGFRTSAHALLTGRRPRHLYPDRRGGSLRRRRRFCHFNE